MSNTVISITCWTSYRKYDIIRQSLVGDIMKGFEIYEYDIDETKKIIVIDIQDISIELEKEIDKYITEIWEGYADGEISDVKKEILKYLGKIEEEKKIGAIAEFFIHLYLKINKYNQYCLFQNLEEDKSFKKGFDGLYSINNENWLVESKSTEKIETKHHSKILEAYNDLNKKVTGKGKNNPWKNAYNHAGNRDLSVPDDVRNTIRKLSKLYVNGIYTTIDAYNIIPCSTKFFNVDEDKENKDNTVNEVENKIESFEFKKIKAICVNSKVADLFIQYLRK